MIEVNKEELIEKKAQELAKDINGGLNTAIIGMGPAGLLSAYFLWLQGHPITLFEKREQYSRDQRIVVTSELCELFMIQTDLWDRNIYLNNLPHSMRNGINFVMINSHKLDANNSLDDEFFFNVD